MSNLLESIIDNFLYEAAYWQRHPEIKEIEKEHLGAIGEYITSGAADDHQIAKKFPKEHPVRRIHDERSKLSIELQHADDLPELDPLKHMSYKDIEDEYNSKEHGQKIVDEYKNLRKLNNELFEIPHVVYFGGYKESPHSTPHMNPSINSLPFFPKEETRHLEASNYGIHAYIPHASIQDSPEPDKQRTHYLIAMPNHLRLEPTATNYEDPIGEEIKNKKHFEHVAFFPFHGKNEFGMSAHDLYALHDKISKGSINESIIDNFLYESLKDNGINYSTLRNLVKLRKGAEKLLGGKVQVVSDQEIDNKPVSFNQFLPPPNKKIALVNLSVPETEQINYNITKKSPDVEGVNKHIVDTFAHELGHLIKEKNNRTERLKSNDPAREGRAWRAGLQLKNKVLKQTIDKNTGEFIKNSLEDYVYK